MANVLDVSGWDGRRGELAADRGRQVERGKRTGMGGVEVESNA